MDPVKIEGGVSDVQMKQRTNNAVIGLSITQLVLAVALFITGYLVIVNNMAFAFVAAPIWGGIVTGSAGVFGIITALKKKGKPKNVAMVLSFVSFFMAIFVLVIGAVAIDEERGDGNRYCNNYWDDLTDDEQKHLEFEKCEHEKSTKQAIDGYIIVIAVVDIAISLINGCYGIKGICCDGNCGDEERIGDGSKKPVSKARKMGIEAWTWLNEFISAVSCCRQQPVQIYLVLNQTGNGLQVLPLVTNMQGAPQPGQNVISPINLQGVSMPTTPDMTGVSQNSTDDELCTTEKSPLL